MHRLILPLICFCISACATTDSISHRSLSFTESIYNNKGKVSILTESMLKGYFPSDAEKRQLSYIEEQFEKKEYTIVDTPPEADFGFIYAIGLSDSNTAGYSISENYISANTLYTHKLVGEFWSVDSRGVPQNSYGEERHFPCPNVPALKHKKRI